MYVSEEGGENSRAALLLPRAADLDSKGADPVLVVWVKIQLQVLSDDAVSLPDSAKSLQCGFGNLRRVVVRGIHHGLHD